MEWLLDGERATAVQPADRGLAYGDGLFETIAVRDGAPRFFERHMARLRDGCRRLALPEPALGPLTQDIAVLTARERRGTLKVIITAGAGPRGYARPAALRLSRLVGFAAEAGGARAGAAGARIVCCRTRASSNPALAGLKTLNRLDSVLARTEWRDERVHEGLMWDGEGRLIGGTMSNVFLVHGGRLLTPALTRCGVRGIMRGVVLEVAGEMGMTAHEADIDAALLAGAEELFLTNALIGLWPVATCDGRDYGARDVTARVAAALAARGVEECGR